MSNTKILRIAMIIAVVVIAFGVVRYMHKTGPQASELVWSEKDLRTPSVPLGVNPIDFRESSLAAMHLWNDYADCRMFSLGTDVVVQSDTGEPCGDITGHEEGHAGDSYQCPSGNQIQYEILISKPGDLRDQMYIVAHELGHVLGLADDGRNNNGVMNQFILVDKKEGEFIKIRPSDKDIAAINEKYCKK